VIELADAGLRWVQQSGGDGWAQLMPTAPAELPMLLGRLGGETQALLDSGRLTVLTSKSRRPVG